MGINKSTLSVKNMRPIRSSIANRYVGTLISSKAMKLLKLTLTP